MSESRDVGGVENSSQPQLVRIIGEPGRAAAGVSGAMPFDHKRAKNLFGVVKCSILDNVKSGQPPTPFPLEGWKCEKLFEHFAIIIY